MTDDGGGDPKPPPLPPVSGGYDAMLPPPPPPQSHAPPQSHEDHGATSAASPLPPDSAPQSHEDHGATLAPSPLPPDSDDPVLPTAYDDSVLREAVGAPPATKHRRAATPPPVIDDDDEDDDVRGGGTRRRRKTIVVSALSLVVGLSIAALVFLGRANSARYSLRCEAERVVVAQGRSFPPWGTHELDDPQWRALKIPAEAECHPRETEDEAELASWYGKLLVDQASGFLQAREVTKVDEAEAQLKQALLVTRLLASDDDRKNQRKDIERMLGDVVYWRASAKLRTAVDALNDAAKQFDAAALQRPRYVDDSAAWATHVRKLADDLRAGPAGAKQTTFPPLPPTTPEHVPAPAGVALPVEPGRTGSDEPPPAAAPADAGLPTGGVLL